jgi:N-acetylneuraminic acid mutarotase
MPQAITHAGVATDGPLVYFAGGFVGERSFEVTANVWRYDTRNDTWTAMTRLPAARAAGGLVRLGSKLYFFGGTNERLGRDFGDHWVLDLGAAPGTAAASWQRLASLPAPRNHVGYAAVGSRFYCIGGQLLGDEKFGNVDDVHVYDPAANRWTAVADLPLPLSHTHTSTVVLDGRIVTVGGKTNDPSFPRTVGDVLSYDPASNTWVALPSLPDIRQAAAAQLIGNRLYVSTGTPRGIDPQAQTWSRQVADVWDAGAALPVAMGEVAGGAVGNKIYLVGEGSGATLAYDLTKGTWSSTSALAQRPFKGHHHAAEVVNGKLYLFGGLGSSSGGKVQIYNPATNAWSTGAAMPFAAGSSASAVIGGKVYVAGGIVGSSTTTRAARYDPQTNTWTEIAPMPRGRNHAASGTDGSRLFVFGGRGPGSGDSNTVANGFDTVQVYNPATNTWTASGVGGSTLRPLPQARGGMGKAVYHDGEFYVIGGETQSGGGGATPDRVYRRVDVYNPSANTWRAGPPMPTARHGIFPLLFAGRIYVAAGGVRAGASASTVLEVLNA